MGKNSLFVLGSFIISFYISSIFYYIIIGKSNIVDIFTLLVFLNIFILIVLKSETIRDRLILDDVSCESSYKEILINLFPEFNIALLVIFPSNYIGVILSSKYFSNIENPLFLEYFIILVIFVFISLGINFYRIIIYFLKNTNVFP
jgi:hypothetical protein